MLIFLRFSIININFFLVNDRKLKKTKQWTQFPIIDCSNVIVLHYLNRNPFIKAPILDEYYSYTTSRLHDRLAWGSEIFL